MKLLADKKVGVLILSVDNRGKKGGAIMKVFIYAIQYVITIFISYLFIVEQSGKLVFLGRILSKELVCAIQKNTSGIFFWLCIAFIITVIMRLLTSNNRVLKSQCDNICLYVYNHLEKQNGASFNRSIRVTIFKATFQDMPFVFLRAFSRYQPEAQYKKPRVIFRPDEGVAGQCFQEGVYKSEHFPDPVKNEHEYNEILKNKYKLTEKNSRKIRNKPREILCVPIKYFNMGKTWGVLCIDSVKQNDVFNNNQNITNIREIADKYQVLLTRREPFWER